MNIKITDFEDSVYTGFLKYEDENYQFVFSGETLRMIPESTEKRNDMWKFGMKEIVQGTYTWGDPPRMEQDVIIGRCNETNQKIVFLPKKGSYIAHQNSVLLIALEAYIICKYERDKIDRIAFTGPEINGIHPTSQAIEYTIVPDSFVNSGTFLLKNDEMAIPVAAHHLWLSLPQRPLVLFSRQTVSSVCPLHRRADWNSSGSGGVLDIRSAGW